MSHVVLRGVHQDIGDEELLSAVNPRGSCGCGRGFVRARRIVDRADRPTGLVRLFSACRDCCALALTDGIEVLGRTYKVEPPHHELQRPCGRCHTYGHAQRDCAVQRPLCRVCGLTIMGSACTHPDHDHSRPFCVTCNKYGHYTGQRSCPRYPTAPSNSKTALPVTIASPPPPPSNPWSMKLKDFPSLSQTPPNPPEPTASGEAPINPQAETSGPDVPPTPPPTSSPPSPQYVSLDTLTSFLEKFLTAVSEGFKRTFDSLTTLILTTVPQKEQRRVRDAVNNISKKMFDMRTIFHSFGPSLNVVHSATKRSDGGG